MRRILYQFEPVGGNEGDGDGTDAVDLDHDAAALLDAADNAGATSELAIGDADGLAGFAEESGVVFEKIDLVGVHGDSTDEVLHLTVGNGEDAVFGTFGGDGISPVAHGQESGLMLEVGDDNTGIVDEDQARDGGDETALDIEVLTVVDDLHGKEVLDALLVEVLVDLEDAVALVVGYSHGVPEGLAHLLLKLFRQEGVTATWDGRGQEGARIVCTHHRCTVVQQHT